MENELIEVYVKKFNEKFPILPTLKGKELHDYKNFLHKCKQIFGLKERGVYPNQSVLFEKLALLWVTWGAYNLKSIGNINAEEIGKLDTEISKVKEVDLEKERISECPYRQVVCTMYEGKILECKGACSWVVDYPKLKELKAQKGE